MLTLLRSVIFQHVLQRKVLALLDILSIAVGVSVFLAIQTANHSANRAFRASIDLTSGKSHLEVRSGTGSISEDLYPKTRDIPGIAAATPVLEAYATLPEHPGRFLHLAGSDAFTAAPFQTAGYWAGTVEAFSLETWLGRPGQIMVHPELARDLGLETGGRLSAELDGRPVTLEIAGLLPANDLGNEASPNLAAIDIGWLQELSRRAGELTSVQLRVDDLQAIETIRQRLEDELPPGVVVQAPRQRTKQVQRMLAGFQLNLTALSMVSMLVGVFLIYNSVSASVVRRRREIGILRANGASRRQVLGLFLGEGLVLGLPGVAIGVPLGLLLATALVGQVAQTISSHYLLLQIRDILVSPANIGLALSYGVVASLAGSFVPALEAARIPPLQALRPRETTAEHAIPLLPLFGWGWGLLAASAASSYLALETGPAWLSFLACLFVIAGFCLLTPWLCSHLARLAGRVRVSILLQTAAENHRRSLHRSAITVAALMTAVGMTIGVSVMVSSFRNTVTGWIDQVMKADLYLTPAANDVTPFRNHLPSGFIEEIRALDGVRQVEAYRQTDLTLAEGHTLALAAVDDPAVENLLYRGGDARAKAAAFLEGPDTVLITEPLAKRLDLRTGDTLDLPSPAGSRPFRIAGVYYDYTDDRGKAVLRLEDFAKYWGDARMHSIAIFLDDPSQSGPFLQQILALAPADLRLSTYTNASLRQRVLEIFDQTFAVTYVLRTIAIAVAIFGVSLSLATLVMERTREIGILRAIGASVNQVRRLYLAEAALIGGFSSAIGILCGLGMAMILTWVVNLAFFGWTIQLRIPWGELAAVPLWLIPAAIIAGLFPARAAARLEVSEATRA